MAKNEPNASCHLVNFLVDFLSFFFFLSSLFFSFLFLTCSLVIFLLLLLLLCLEGKRESHSVERSKPLELRLRRHSFC